MKLPSSAKPEATETNPTQIVLTGCGNFSMGAYKSLSRHLGKAIRDGKVQLTLISTEDFHTAYGFMQECITGMLDYADLLVPVKTCYRQAKHVRGKVIAIEKVQHELMVQLPGGKVFKMRYDHLVCGDQYFSTSLQVNKTLTGFSIQSTLDMRKTHKQLNSLAQRAALAPDRFTAARILRLAIVGNGLAGVELAANIAAYLQDACRKLSLQHMEPTLHLVLNEPTLLAGKGNDKLSAYAKRQLEESGIRIINNKQVIRVNTDGAVLDDGSFINCSIVFCTDHESQNECHLHAAFIAAHNNSDSTDEYGRIRDNKNAWFSKIHQNGIMPAASQYILAIKEGEAAGRNIARSIQNRPLLANQKPASCIAGSLGNGKAFALLFGLPITGSVAFCIRVIRLLFLMPASNRNSCLKAYYKYYRQRHKATREWSPVVSLSKRRFILQKVAF
ncbi:hypothetical protein BH10BAC3_BH10BAC3_30090 [soil metagenome]